MRKFGESVYDSLEMVTILGEDAQTFCAIGVQRMKEIALMKMPVPIAAIALAILLAFPGNASAGIEEDELVTKARFTVERMTKDENVGPNVRKLIQRAKAVMVFPNVLKGAFFFGAEGGSGVLVAKDSKGNWGYPAFFTMGSASFGLQIGGQSQEIVLLIMSDRGLSSILHNEVKLGGDISAAAGPVGVGAEASTTTNFRADIYSFSINQGAFLGASVEGAVIHPRQSKNKAYYGSEKVTPEDIVLKGRYQNVQANQLRASLRRLR